MRITSTLRRRLLRRMIAAATLAGFTMFGLHYSAPRAEAAGSTLEDCIEGVDNLVDSCLGDDAGWARSYACKWAGGVGYLACVSGEALKEIAKKLPLAA